MGAALNFFTQYEQDRNDLLEQIIPTMKIGSIFTTQKENQQAWFEKNRGRNTEKIQEWVLH